MCVHSSINLTYWSEIQHDVSSAIECCMSEHFVKFHDECTDMCYWWHYLPHGVCQTNVVMNIIL
jgi:hypothetical protein